MQKYDTYSPEVGLYKDTGVKSVRRPDVRDGSPHIEGNGNDDDSARGKGNASRRVTTRRVSKTRTERNSSGARSPEAGRREKITSARMRQNAVAPSIRERIKDFVNNQTFRVVSGLFLLFLGTWLAISLISFVSVGIADQPMLAANTSGIAKVSNYGGEGGARLSEILIDDGFGVASAVIIFWLVMMSLKLLTGGKKIGRFKTLNFSIKCMIALVTASLIIGLVTIGMDVPFNLGGAHGRYVNQAIIDFIGWAGAGLLCLFMLTLFVVICLNDVVRWFLRKKAARDAVKAELRARKEAEEARIREMEESARKDILEEARAGDHREVTDEHQNDMDKGMDSVDFVNRDRSSESGVSSRDVHEEEMTYVYDDGEENLRQDGKENPQHDVEDSPQSDVEDSRDPAGIRTDRIEAKEVSDSAVEDMVMKVNVNHIATVDEENVKENKRSNVYHFPPTALLHAAPERIELDRSEQLENKERIRRTLLDFGIPITNIEATVGPTVTLYEIIPEPGIKISSIRSRDEDIARSLSATGVRIIAPMPGKGTVGIEVPNKDPQIVSMRTVITSRKYKECKYELPMALGSTISNEVYIADLTKMPHVLVAGATGQGKSVGLNTIITSLLYRKQPSELKFVMIDPKMVELSLYSMLEKHYLAKMPGEEDAIITDVQGKVLPALSSLCVEMDARYELLKSARVRAVKEYNEKFRRGELSKADGHRFMPYIVVVVDEYSDLVMTAGKEVEKPIARLAQKARAIGIHLIVATQRPSTDVVTGMIKANFPARIAFKVSSGVDSKTILNTTAAQQLIGRGDMLISAGSELERVQCAFIDTPEVEDICTFISQQPCEEEPYILPEPLTGGDKDDVGDGFGDHQPLDPLLEEVARQIINMDQASTSGIQRRYNIGYNRAGRIMDQLERAGVVGPSHGGKPRAVLVDPATLERILQSMGV